MNEEIKTKLCKLLQKADIKDTEKDRKFWGYFIDVNPPVTTTRTLSIFETKEYVNDRYLYTFIFASTSENDSLKTKHRVTKILTDSYFPVITYLNSEYEYIESSKEHIFVVNFLVSLWK